MKKIKLLLEKLLNNVKNVFTKFPITMLIVLIVTVLSSVCLNDFIIKEKILRKIVIIGIIWGVGTLFSETYLKDKKFFKYASFVIELVVAVFFYNHLMDRNSIFGWNIEKTTVVLGNIFATYMISISLLTLYKLSKESNLNIKEYLLKVYSETFIVGITFSVLCAGISAVSAIFIYLILDGEFSEFILRMLILALGIFYIPSIVSVFSNAEKIKLNSFVEKLLLYVIMPLTMIAILIIYIYIAKFLILKDIPKNTIGRILIAVYLVAIPVWGMVKATKKENFVKVSNIIPYIYLPLMILEIYSILKRIFDYGFTPIRYLGVLFIIFQLISFFIIIIKKEKYLRELILVVILFAVIYLISPLNYNVVSNLSQKNILDKYVENGIKFESCSKEERKTYRGAYKYLINQYNGKKYINDKISEEDKKQLGSYIYEDDDYITKTQSIYYHKNLEEMDISKYAKIYSFEDTINYNEKVNTSKIQIEYGKGKIEYINLYDYIRNVINYNEKYNDYEDYCENNNIIELDNSKTIYVTSMNFSYNIDYKVNYLNIEGYILEK